MFAPLRAMLITYSLPTHLVVSAYPESVFYYPVATVTPDLGPLKYRKYVDNYLTLSRHKTVQLHQECC